MNTIENTIRNALSPLYQMERERAARRLGDQVRMVVDDKTLLCEAMRRYLMRTPEGGRPAQWRHEEASNAAAELSRRFFELADSGVPCTDLEKAWGELIKSAAIDFVSTE